MALRMAGLGRGGAADEGEMGRQQANAGDRQYRRFHEQAGVQAVIEMGDEAEQAQDAERGEDPVAGGEAEQKDQGRRGEAGGRQREEPEDRGGAGGGERGPAARSEAL